VADPDQAFGGAVKLGGAKNVFTCLNIKGCLRQSLCVTHKWLSSVKNEISEKQYLKRIPDLVRNRTVLLRLGSDNLCRAI